LPQSSSASRFTAGASAGESLDPQDLTLNQNDSGLPQGPTDPAIAKARNAANRLRHAGRRLV
jgi:hypothetical protein